MPGKTYFVYILANRHRQLYIGVTNNLIRRVEQHRGNINPGYAERHGITQLVLAEAYDNVQIAIAREKQLKSWRRGRKLALIERLNPDWVDLASAGLLGAISIQVSR